MDWILENAFKVRKIDDEDDRAYLIVKRSEIRDIEDYKPSLTAIGKNWYNLYLEDCDPNYCIRDGFGYEAIGQGVVNEEHWIKLPSGAYAQETCIFDCQHCPYGFGVEDDCTQIEKRIINDEWIRKYYLGK